MASKPCVYFCPLYGAGHLIPMVELAKRLLQLASALDNSFSSHFILMLPENPNHGSPLCSSYLQSLRAENTPIQLHVLPFIELPTCFDSMEEFLTIRVRSYLPLIKASLLAAPSPVSGPVLDVFASDAIDVANELNIPSYIYQASNAAYLALLFYLSCQQGETNLKDFSEVEDICVPGLVPIPSTCLPNLFSNKKSESTYKWLMHHARRSSEARAVIVNTNIYLEKTAVEAFTEGTPHAPAKTLPDIYPVGPVVALGDEKSQKHECWKWLEMQPMKSVVFLCFGSMGTFDVAQNKQIASALEQSGHHFLWVLRTASKEFLR